MRGRKIMNSVSNIWILGNNIYSCEREHLQFLYPRRTEARKKGWGQGKEPGAIAILIYNYESAQALQANGQAAEHWGTLLLQSAGWRRSRRAWQRSSKTRWSRVSNVDQWPIRWESEVRLARLGGGGWCARGGYRWAGGPLQGKNKYRPALQDFNYKRQKWNRIELRGHQSHVKDCFLSGVVVWKYLKAKEIEQVKREKEWKIVKKKKKSPSLTRPPPSQQTLNMQQLRG